MNYKLFKATIVAMAAVVSVACTDQVDMTLSTPQESSCLTMDSIDNNFDVYKYVQQRKDDFGNVLIFNSMDEVNKLLQDMANMDYSTLRAQYMILQAEFGFKNAIIESNIFYDSIYSTVAQEYGYNLLAENVEIEEEDFYIELEQRLLANNQNLLSVCQKQGVENIVSVSDETFIEPLGHLDWSALLNEKNIFVAANTVYAFIEDSWLIIPIEEYCNSINTKTIKQKIQATTYTAASTYNDEKRQKNHVGMNEDKTRMLTVDIDATAVYLQTVQSALAVTMTIGNYKKNGLGNWVKQWSHVDGHCECYVRYIMTNEVLHPSPWYWFRDFSEEYVKGTKTYTNTEILPYVLNSISKIYPFNISIGLSNWQGCRISY